MPEIAEPMDIPSYTEDGQNNGNSCETVKEIHFFTNTGHHLPVIQLVSLLQYTLNNL
jgi:hypothetical protein